MATGLNLASLRILLRRYIDDVGGQRFTDSNLNSFLNEGQKTIQSIIDDADENFFSACQSYAVLPDTDSYEFALPDTCKKVIMVERLVSNGQPIPGSYIEFRKRHDDSISFEPATLYGISSGPVYYLRGSKIGIVAPSESYTMRLWYTYTIPDLSADSDYSEIPNEFRNLIALSAAMLTKGEVAGSSNEIPETLLKEYDEGVQRLRTFIESRQRQTSRMVNYFLE
jgi:hypothetical protein